MIAWAYKAQISCIFGQWAKAESIYKDMITLSETFYFSYAVMISSLYGGIASYSLYNENKSRKHLNVARRHRKFLHRAFIRGCPNAFAFLTLLNAEDISIKKSVASNTVIQAYDIAIATMATEKLPNFEALAKERAGYYAIQCGNRILAKLYFDQALELYNDTWGAVAKYDWLVETVEKKMSRLPP
jgi:tetratricopeptide (TPR) repeat protein